MPEDVLHHYCILSCIPIDCSLSLTFTNFSSCWPGIDRFLDVMSILVSVALFYTMTNTLSWDVPGDVLAAPESALYGWIGVIPLCLSLSLSDQPEYMQPCLSPAAALPDLKLGNLSDALHFCGQC